MGVFAITLSCVLILIGLVHLVWAAGSTWPYKDEAHLAKAVVGSRDVEKMPPKYASAFVALCLFGAAAVPLLIRGINPFGIPKIIVFFGGVLLAGIFGLRGVLGVLPAFERMAPEQPFLSLNRKFYSPLSVLIGMSFALLVLSMPNWTWRLGG